ncbi:MAG: hypothetical protein J5506_10970 [Prevotella sp.]|nr:hypothetical protein [Prevotella sp.]
MDWYEQLPPLCPPTDAVQCGGTFYRIAKGNPAKDVDFFSQRKMQPNKVFTNLGIDECIARSISLFSEVNDAVRRLRLPKFRNAKVAEVVLQPKDGMMKKTFSDSHYSWWRSTAFDVSQAKTVEL